MPQLTPLGYRIVKIREPVSQRLGLLFTVSLPEIKQGERPRRRFMSAFEQKREIPNRAFQYFVVSPSTVMPFYMTLGLCSVHAGILAKS
jgi:hypothetical protein